MKRELTTECIVLDVYEKVISFNTLRDNFVEEKTMFINKYDTFNLLEILGSKFWR